MCLSVGPCKNRDAPFRTPKTLECAFPPFCSLEELIVILPQKNFRTYIYSPFQQSFPHPIRNLFVLYKYLLKINKKNTCSLQIFPTFKAHILCAI